jgi:hypothetical protein
MSGGRLLQAACGVALATLAVGCGSTPSSELPVGVYLFAVAQHDCNLGGREGADALVQAGAPSQLQGKTIHAFLSVSETDEIADMPANYGVPTDLPVYSAKGDYRLATSWSELFGHIDQALDVTLHIDSGSRWWSGSQANGSVATQTCAGWTTSADTAHTGLTSNVAAAWMDDSDATGTETHYVLGIAYDAPAP